MEDFRHGRKPGSIGQTPSGVGTTSVLPTDRKTGEPQSGASWGIQFHSVRSHVVRKLRNGSMPPQPRPRPDRVVAERLTTYLEAALDRAAVANPDPGRTATLRRLNRTEYQNAIRDLLALEIDVTALLPRDDAAFGFDNVTTGSLWVANY